MQSRKLKTRNGDLPPRRKKGRTHYSPLVEHINGNVQDDVAWNLRWYQPTGGLFAPGTAMASDSALRSLGDAEAISLIERHLRGDFGLACSDQVDHNLAVIAGTTDAPIISHFKRCNRYFVVRTDLAAETTKVITRKEFRLIDWHKSLQEAVKTQGAL